jgi:predicted nucleic acid-binding protein
VILYLDTSALVKLYVAEAGTEAVAAAAERATALVTVRITYAEAHAAFAQHARTKGLGSGALRRVVRQLDEEWSQYSIVEVTDALVRRAGVLAERHRLRGWDAVQMSAALDLRAAGATDVAFASFDVRLNHAARRERLGLLSRPWMPALRHCGASVRPCWSGWERSRRSERCLLRPPAPRPAPRRSSSRISSARRRCAPANFPPSQHFTLPQMTSRGRESRTLKRQRRAQVTFLVANTSL